MIKTTVVTSATGEPVTTAEILDHLRISTTDENDLLDALEIAARQRAESMTGRRLMPQTIKTYRNQWPGSGCAALPFAAPLQSIPTTGVVYKMSTGNSTTFSSTAWIADVVGEPGSLCLEYNSDWPSDTLHNVNPISIEYKVGYSTAGASTDGTVERGAVPQGIKLAIKMMVGHWYENREDTHTRFYVNDIPLASRALLSPFKVAQITS